MAPRRCFRGTGCLFLPIAGGYEDEIEEFKALGGTVHEVCHDDTAFIVAPTWDLVVSHFAPFPGLLRHFLSQDVNMVSYSWLRNSTAAQSEVPFTPYLLNAMEAMKIETFGASNWEDRIEAPDYNSPRTLANFWAKKGRYEVAVYEERALAELESSQPDDDALFMLRTEPKRLRFSSPENSA